MTGPVAIATASDAPRREGGTRVRSGNAMQRARGAVLDATEHCVARYGVRRTTMGDIALKAAVAKATLYNHFRAKDDVLAALVAARVDELAQRCTGVAAADGLAAALEHAARAVAGSGALRRVVADEPGLAARLATPGDSRDWAAVHEAVAGVLRAAGADERADAVELVLRWLVGQVLWPADDVAAAAQAVRLAAAVTAAAAPPVG